MYRTFAAGSPCEKIASFFLNSSTFLATPAVSRKPCTSNVSFCKGAGLLFLVASRSLPIANRPHCICAHNKQCIIRGLCCSGLCNISKMALGNCCFHSCAVAARFNLQAASELLHSLPHPRDANAKRLLA